MVSYQNKHFRIRDKDVFLYGAECHYFRLDPSEWADRLHKMKEAGFNLVSTYVPWIWHEPTEGEIDLEGKTHPRRNLAAFLDLCQSLDLYCIVRPGPYVMSELKNEGIPEWLLATYPEVIARDRYGNLHPTRVVSYLHPTYLRLAQTWYEHVCSCVSPRLITRGGNVIMFQLDNEIGMLHWVTNTADHNTSALARYESFKADRGIQDDATRSTADEHWRQVEFRRREWAEYVRVLKSLAERNGIDVPFIVNVHGFKDFSVYSRGVDYPIGLSQLKSTGEIDDVIIAGDFYPGKIGYDNFHDLILSSALTESISPAGQPLFSAEFQSGRLADRPRIYPSDVDLITRLCVASGMNALNYYMFCGGDNVEGIGLFGRRHEWQAPIASNGELRPSYDVTKHLGRLYTTLGSLLCGAPRSVDTHIGFYSPYYATEVADRNDPQVNQIVSHIEHQREQYHFDGVWRLLAAANISFDAIDVQKDIDVDAAPTLWMCTTKYMDRHTQQRLADYVEQGGKLVIGPELPAYDLSGRPCDVLANVLGTSVQDERYGFQRVTIGGIDSVFCRQYSVLELPDDAEITAFTEAGAHEPLGFTRAIGRGQVLVLGAALTHEYQYQIDVIRKLASYVGIEPVLRLSNDNLVATERLSDQGKLISVINVDDVAHETYVTRYGTDVFDGQSVCVAPRTGKLLPVDWELAHGVKLKYSTVEVTGLEATESGVRLRVSIPARDAAVLAFATEAKLQVHSDEMLDAVDDVLHGYTIRYRSMEEPREVQIELVKSAERAGSR